MPTLIDDPDVIGLRLRDAAKAMNVSARFLQLKIESGELNAIRPRALRIRPDDLRTYIEERLTENEINPKPC